MKENVMKHEKKEAAGAGSEKKMGHTGTMSHKQHHLKSKGMSKATHSSHHENNKTHGTGFQPGPHYEEGEETVEGVRNNESDA